MPPSTSRQRSADPAMDQCLSRTVKSRTVAGIRSSVRFGASPRSSSPGFDEMDPGMRPHEVDRNDLRRNERHLPQPRIIAQETGYQDRRRDAGTERGGDEEERDKVTRRPKVRSVHADTRAYDSPRCFPNSVHDAFSVAVSSVGSPIALAMKPFDAIRNPSNKNGMMTGQGNLVDAKAMLQTPGSTIAANQRMEFHISIFFFSDLVTGHLRFGWV